MAVTLRIGQATKAKQLKLDFEKTVGATEVIDEIVYCLEVLNQGQSEAVENHMNNRPYSNIFVALSEDRPRWPRR